MAQDKILPPLRVKLIGDSREFDRMLLVVEQRVKALHAGIKGLLGAGAAKGGRVSGNAHLNKLAIQAQAHQNKLALQAQAQTDRLATLAQSHANRIHQNRMNQQAKLAAQSQADANRLARVQQMHQNKLAAQAQLQQARLRQQLVRTTGEVLGKSVVQAGRVAGVAITQAGRALNTAITQAGRVASVAFVQGGRVASAAIRSATQAFAAASKVAAAGIKTVGTTVSNVVRSAAGVLSTGIRTAGSVASNAMRAGAQLGAAAIRASGQTAAASIRQAGISARAANRAPTQRSSSPGGSGGGGVALGNRADIYMHANALRNVMDASRGLFDTNMQLEMLTVGVSNFTGGMQSAAKVMREIQDYAIVSPYDTLNLATAARNMMAYGASSAETMTVMKQLGDVAGGNAERMNLLMYAMSQVNSLGKLQGNELRQLTEQGFNPLEYWARKTKTSYETMEDAMRRMNKMKEDGLVTSQMVKDALAAETSAGGRFFEAAKKLNDSMIGLGNQMRELWKQRILVRLLSMIEPQVKATMKRMVELSTAVDAWMNDPNNYTIIQQMANAAKNAALALALFHSIGFAVAGLRWWLHSVVVVAGAFRALLVPILLLVQGIGAAFNVLRYVAALSWTAMLGPIGWLLLAVPFLGLAVYALATSLASPGGLSGAFTKVWESITWFWNAANGFMANFGENMQILGAYVYNNWWQMLQDLGNVFLGVLGALPGNVLVGLRAMARLLVAFGAWMYTNVPKLFSRAFDAVYNYLADFFHNILLVGQKVWEYMSNPSKWGADSMAAINGFIDTLNKDVATATTEGFGAAAKAILDEEAANLRSGVEGLSSTLPSLELNLKAAKIDDGPMGPEKPDMPPVAQSGGLSLPGGLGGSYQASEALSARSGEFAKKMAEYSAAMSAGPAGANTPQVQQQMITNALLKALISKIPGGSLALNAAGIGGIP